MIRIPLCYINRCPLVQISYFSKNSKTFEIPDGEDFTQKLFVQFFMDEIRLRWQMRKSTPEGLELFEKRYSRLINRVANNIWKISQKYKINPVNLSFVFLNRFYPMFTGKSNPVTQLNYHWEDFLIKISNDQELLMLLNYDIDYRKFICSIIQEMREIKTSRKFKRFIDDYCNGLDLVWPVHFHERTMLFETVLLMLNQINVNKLNYFLENHTIEIFKAHALGLKKFGDPIHIHCGHLMGDNAMYRLKNYMSWLRRNKPENQYRFDNVSEIGSKAKVYEF